MQTGNMKKTIKCKFLGWHDDVKRVIGERYTVVETDTPDFVFFDCHNQNDCVDYPCVRIIFIGENQRPNFNLFDYAAGFDKIQFEDRYLYFPIYVWGSYKEDVKSALEKHMRSNEYFLSKKKFCNMVVSNVRDASDKRIEFFQRLCNYKKVDSGGKSNNNLPDGKPVIDKKEFQEGYKFSLAFENSTYKGYTTEKIVQAWAAGTIPIYWGDPSIAEQFNEKAFINCHAYSNWDEVIEKIVEIDNDNELYLNMQQEPICNDSSGLLELMSDNYLKNWLYPILDKEPKEAIWRTNAHEGWGWFCERDTKRLRDMYASKLVMLAVRVNNFFSGHKDN